jgi:hypothetical protein
VACSACHAGIWATSLLLDLDDARGQTSHPGSFQDWRSNFAVPAALVIGPIMACTIVSSTALNALDDGLASASGEDIVIGLHRRSLARMPGPSARGQGRIDEYRCFHFFSPL